MNIEQLEQTIDKDQLWNVLLSLEVICGEKADHIEHNGHNWQDRKTAAVWRRWSRKLGTMARQAEKENI